MDKYLESFEIFGKKEIVGYTRLGREIPLFHGSDKKANVLLVGGVHAREHITCELLKKLFVEEGKGLAIDYLPILNIDGVLLCKYGSASVKNVFLRQNLVRLNGGIEDFSQWKANAYGVDINVNFDADWGEGRYNETTPGAANYIGASPASEPETQCAVNVLKRQYSLVVSYHSLGEEVYWGYENNFLHYKEAKKYAAGLGYVLKRSENSCGGLKDYYALNYGGLGLTVEIGEEKYGHPYPEDKLDLITVKHRGSLKELCETGDKIYAKLHGGSN